MIRRAMVPALAPLTAPAGAAFAELAAAYDDHFSYSLLGRLLRQAVWRRLDARFPSGSRILDLGCGTGEDAVYLAGKGMQVVAVDAAEPMVEAARGKAAAAGLEHRVDIRHATIESLALEPDAGSAFDGALSNFGALNCCTMDFASLARGIANRLRPGAPLVLVVMGPLVPWEWGWFLSHGQPRAAFRRLRARGVLWRGVRVRYPSIRSLHRAFAQDFDCVRVSALGCLLPPSYVRGWPVRRPRVLHTLDRWERRLETVRPLASLADHYVLELERH